MKKRVLSCVELQIINNYFLALYFKLNGTMFHVLNMSCTLQINKSVGNLSAIWLQTICKYSRPQPTPLLVEAGFLQILPSLSIGNDDIYFYHHHHDQIHHHYQQQHHQYQQQHNNNDHCQHHHHCHYFVSIRNSSFKTQHSQRPVLPSPSTSGRLSGGKIADGLRWLNGRVSGGSRCLLLGGPGSEEQEVCRNPRKQQVFAVEDT